MPGAVVVVHVADTQPTQALITVLDALGPLTGPDGPSRAGAGRDGEGNGLTARRRSWLAVSVSGAVLASLALNALVVLLLGVSAPIRPVPAAPAPRSAEALHAMQIMPDKLPVAEQSRPQGSLEGKGKRGGEE